MEQIRQTKPIGFMPLKTSKSIQPLTYDVFTRLIDSDMVLGIIRSIEKTTDQEEKNRIKGQLPVALYSCICPEDGQRPTLQTAVPSHLCIHDWDHMDGDVREFYLNNIAGHEEEQGIMLVHKTPRGEGLRLVTKMTGDETPAHCQARFADMYGMQAKADTSIKDITRLSFIPTREYFFYINKEMFDMNVEAESTEEVVVEETATKLCPPMKVCNEVQALPAASSVSSSEKAETLPATPDEPNECISINPLAEEIEYEGIKMARIIETLLSRIATDGTPREGERNNDLYMLVRELRHICNYSFELIRLLVTPYFSTLPDREIRKVVNSALNSNGRTMTTTMRGILNDLKTCMLNESATEDKATKWPAMPKLPPFMEMIAKHYPSHIRRNVVLAMLPILGTYGTHIRFRYLDNRVNSLSFEVAVVGKSSQGKGFANHLFNMLTGRLAEWDNTERKKAQEYQETLKKRREKDAVPDDPRPRVRLYADDITTSMMLEYMDNLGGEHGLQFTEEVSRLIKARKSTYGDNSDIYCKAFDNGIGGKESKNNMTRNLRIPIYLNTLFCGTNNHMHEFYNDPEGGLNNRIIFAPLPDTRHKGIPRYEDLTPDEQQELDAMLDTLWMAGTLPGDDNLTFPFLDKAFTQWIAKADKDDIENPNDTWRDLANRSAVLGYRAGVLAYLLYGRPQEQQVIRQIVRFAIWVADTTRLSIYDFCGKEYDKINEEINAQPKTRQTKNKKLFSVLNDSFSIQELTNMRRQHGESTNVAMIISRWSQEGLIRKQPDGSFMKMKKIS